MNCELTMPLLDAYVDGELNDIATLHAVQAHVRTCEACSRSHRRLLAVRDVIQAKAPVYRAGDALRKRIQSDLRSSLREAPQVRDRFLGWRWVALAASLLLTVAAIWQIQFYPRAESGDLLAREVVSGHVRSMMAEHLVDEPSSDQHAVKPWFAGKLDFSPVVKNLDSLGFMLAGGRLDYLNGRAVAAVVYRRRQHIINLFMWPSSSPVNARTFTANGFNVSAWQADGMQFRAISDLNSTELELFSRLVADSSH